MSKTVLVGCKLPCGIELDGPSGIIAINGKNTSLISGGFGLTHVDASDWAYIMAVYAEHSAFKNNAIFTTGSDTVSDVAALGEELAEEKTGLEGLDPNKPAPNLKPEDSGKLNAMLQENKGKVTPGKAAKSKADRAAAMELAQGKA